MGRHQNLVAFFVIAASVFAMASFARQPLSFEERVKAQEAIERVYYNHRIWPKENPGPKPPFEQMVPKAQIEAKVTETLKKSAALGQYWQRPITGEQLQAEMDRMAKGTKDPATLLELFAALDNDPTLIAECLARPVLADRLIHTWYAYDTRFHGEARRSAEAARDRGPAAWPGLKEGQYRLVKYDKQDSRLDKRVQSHDLDGTGNIALDQVEFDLLLNDAPTGGRTRLKENEDGFLLVHALAADEAKWQGETWALAKRPFRDWWEEVRLLLPIGCSLSGADRYRLPNITVGESCALSPHWEVPVNLDAPIGRSLHTAIWTGDRMIVWGGSQGGGDSLNSGYQYDPTTDTWTPTSIGTNCPVARDRHTAVWTGSRMIVWGGQGDVSPYILASGGQYDPLTDSWTRTSETGDCPSGRGSHVAVWTGTEMVIWGGYERPSPNYCNTGGRYNPVTDGWTATSTGPNCPSARASHSAVWTGLEMLIWGGWASTSYSNTGGRYNPSTDTWITTSTSSGCPTARGYHTAIWTGAEMIIWGGYWYSGGPHYEKTGGRYDPAGDTWTATSASASCPSERYDHAAVWTGTEMIVWGGSDGTNLDSGGRYDPQSDSWVETSRAQDCPVGRRSHSAVWTGTQAIVWGGYPFFSDGGKYDPLTDSWTPTAPATPYPIAAYASGVWTGNHLIVWAGINSKDLNSGSLYDPATDNWTRTSTGINCPSPRVDHTAIWTGTEMIVWGGHSYFPGWEFYNTGGRYDPTADTWMPTSTGSFCPDIRYGHTAEWTGSRMMVWGGQKPDGSGYLDSGGLYDPITDIWVATSKGSGCPSPRCFHSMVWTGSGMIVWGGYNDQYPSPYLNSGGQYDPISDMWSATSSGINCPSGREGHSAIWTGSRMIVWGGWDGLARQNSGAKYDPIADSWTATSSSVNCPSARSGAAVLWTGGKMVVWGGYDGTNRLKTGGEYDQELDSWTETSTDPPCPSERVPGIAVWTGEKMLVWGGNPAHSNGALYDPGIPVFGLPTSCEGTISLSTKTFASYQWMRNGLEIPGATSQMLIVSAPGSYSVRATDALGCVGVSEAFGVSIYSPPTPTVIGPSSACKAVGGFLTTELHSSYQWLLNGMPIPGAVERSYLAHDSGAYAVLVTNASGCLATSPELDFTAWSEPVTSITGPSQACLGENITLDAGPGYASYLWSPGSETTQTIQVSPSATTTYSVTVSDGMCTGSDSHTVAVPAPIPVVSDSDASPQDQPRQTFGSTNGDVYAVVESGGVLYVGGDFTRVGPATGHGIGIDMTSGLPDLTYPQVDGEVMSVEADGAGGWFIGGYFTRVGDVPRYNLAHILPDKTVDPSWDPAPDNTVQALLLSGTTLYVGGAFWGIGGVERPSLAALDTASGIPTAWTPQASGTVYALAISGSTVYVGGDFYYIGGQERHYIAALDIATGNATAWNPSADYYVLDLVPVGSTIYVGGYFWNIGGQARYSIAALDATTGLATDWNPSADGEVSSLVVSGSTVYAGGSFWNIGGQERHNLAAIDAVSGVATGWNPGPDGNVYAMVPSGSTLIIGGYFLNIGGQSRRMIAALDTASGIPTEWSPDASEPVRALAVSGSIVYVGGAFSMIGGEARRNLAAFDAATGKPTSWNPNATGVVQTLAMSGGIVYVGGEFTTIGGQARNRIAAIEASTGSATPWNPSANGSVSALALSASTIFVGGGFTSIGGQPRNQIAALDITTGMASAWNPNANGWVSALTTSGALVYAGGYFTSIGGQPRNRIAALNINTAQATAWNPNANDAVRALAISGSVLYAGGFFTSVGGQTRRYIAALDLTTGSATAWNPNASYYVTALGIAGSRLYAGGYFYTIGGQSRRSIASLDVATGNASSWNPSADSVVTSLAFSGSVFYMGGTFSTVGDQLHRGLAAFDSQPSADGILCPGDSRVFVSSPAVTHQWFKDGVLIPGATQQSFTATEAGAYTVEVAYTTGCNNTSIPVVLTSPALPVVTGSSSSCEGAGVPLATQSFLSYQWYRDASPISGATASEFTASESGSYTVEVVDSNGCQMMSAAHPVSILSNPTPTIDGASSGCLSPGVSLTTQSFMSQQWIKDGADIPGAIAPAYGATQSGTYSVRVTDSNGCLGTSPPKVVTITPNPTPVVTGAASGCASPGVPLAAGTSTAYQWIKDDLDIPGATLQSYTVGASGTYAVRVTDSNGCLGTSPGHPVTIYPNPAPTISGPSPACSSAFLSTGSFASYQWYRNNNPIPGATAQSFAAPVPGTYKVRVTDAKGCTGTSADFIVRSLPTPSVTGAASGCGSVMLSTGAFASYQWNLNGSPIGGANAQAFTAAVSGNYSITVTDNNGCGGTSAAKAVTVYPPAVPVVTGSHFNTCPQTSVPLSAPLGFVSYQWALNGVPIAGATVSALPAGVTGYYSVSVTDSYGCMGLSEGFPVFVDFCPESEVSPTGASFPARLRKESGSPTGYYLYFQRLDSLNGYNIYEGEIGTYYSHAGAAGNVCNATVEDLITGEMRAAITPSTGNHYYVVTAHSGGAEGPSGFNWLGTEIPASQSTCTP